LLFFLHLGAQIENHLSIIVNEGNWSTGYHPSPRPFAFLLSYDFWYFWCGL